MANSLLIVGTSHSAGSCIEHPSDKRVGQAPINWLSKDKRWFRSLYDYYAEIVVLARPGATTHEQFFALKQYMSNNPDKRFTNCILEGRGLRERNITYVSQTSDVELDFSDNVSDKKIRTSYDYYLVDNKDKLYYDEHQLQEVITSEHASSIAERILDNKWDNRHTSQFKKASEYFVAEYLDSWIHLIENCGINLGMLNLMETISKKALYFPFNFPSLPKENIEYLEQKNAWLYNMYKGYVLNIEDINDVPLDYVEKVAGTKGFCNCGHANQYGTSLIAEKYTASILEYFNNGTNS